VTARRPGEGPERSAVQEVHAVAALSDEVLPAMIARFRRSRLGELEVRSNGWRVRLRRELAPVAGGALAAASGASGEATGTDEALGVARSSAVGYFSPGRDIAIGRFVRAGDSLGSVDVLGIMQEVTAPIDGVISRILAEPGQAVEYGQALADIEATGVDELSGAT